MYTVCIILTNHYRAFVSLDRDYIKFNNPSLIIYKLYLLISIWGKQHDTFHDTLYIKDFLHIYAKELLLSDKLIGKVIDSAY